MECLLEQSWDRWPVPSSRWLSTLSAASPLSSTQTTVYKQCSHLQLKRHCSFPAERYSCFCNLVTVVEGQMQSRKKGNHKDNRTLSALVWSFTEDLLWRPQRPFLILVSEWAQQEIKLWPLPQVSQRAHLFTHDLYCAEWQACVKFFWKGMAGTGAWTNHRTSSSVAPGTQNRISSSTGKTTKQ